MTEELRNRINEYFIGKEELVDNVLICLFAGGHVLLEDVPGVGKTTLARTVAGAVECSFGRIQFTPDTLPGDVTGISVYNRKTDEFEYREGAIMKQLILADEINRTSPKTQSSLLEAMAEGQVTVDTKTYKLPDPFMVIATQNPIEFVGTYPLPEAATDRFMMRLSIGYPTPESEIRMVRNRLDGKGAEKIGGVCTAEDIVRIRKEVSAVRVNDNILAYVRNIVDMTRKEKSFTMGASPRATMFIVSAAQAHAYLNGHEFVKPDDVKAVAVNVLHHRISLTPEAKIRKESVDNILKSLVIKANVPMD